MKAAVELLAVVALSDDLPEYNLWRGQVGTVVEVLGSGEAYEVEFADRHGHTYESVGLTSDQVIVLRYEPVEPPMAPALAMA